MIQLLREVNSLQICWLSGDCRAAQVTVVLTCFIRIGFRSLNHSGLLLLSCFLQQISWLNVLLLLLGLVSLFKRLFLNSSDALWEKWINPKTQTHDFHAALRMSAGGFLSWILSSTSHFQSVFNGGPRGGGSVQFSFGSRRNPNVPPHTAENTAAPPRDGFQVFCHYHELNILF